ncbi:initiation-control protein yabA [Streptococcus pyogenes]|nr:initiation-control protein yabA [Streptococcus pyogenes]
MNKKELFDAFDGFSQNLMVTLAEIEAMKKQVQITSRRKHDSSPRKYKTTGTFESPRT